MWKQLIIKRKDWDQNQESCCHWIQIQFYFLVFWEENPLYERPEILFVGVYGYKKNYKECEILNQILPNKTAFQTLSPLLPLSFPLPLSPPLWLILLILIYIFNVYFLSVCVCEFLNMCTHKCTHVAQNCNKILVMYPC